MKAIRLLVVAAAAAWACLLPEMAAGAAQKSPDKIRLLVITGGHGFQKDSFFQLFADNPDIAYQAVEHPNAHARLTAEAAKQYDVIVTYDYNQAISEEAKANFLERLKEGKGLVALHHAIAAYPNWPEYWNIIGARYYLAATNINGVAKPRSKARDDMTFRIHVADPRHPVTRGIKDFMVRDETYKWFDVAPKCHPLLTTDEPENNEVLSWAKTYRRARVVYLQLGHDRQTYENPNYQQLLRQAIRWVARRH